MVNISLVPRRPAETLRHILNAPISISPIINSTGSRESAAKQAGSKCVLRTPYSRAGQRGSRPQWQSRHDEVPSPCSKPMRTPIVSRSKADQESRPSLEIPGVPEAMKLGDWPINTCVSLVIEFAWRYDQTAGVGDEVSCDAALFRRDGNCRGRCCTPSDILSTKATTSAMATIAIEPLPLRIHGLPRTAMLPGETLPARSPLRG